MTARWRAVAVAPLGLGLVAPVWYWNGGLMEIEALQFIRQYLADRTLLEKVFDPHANDFNTYQARELSYLVDYIDAHVFKLLMGYDLTLFVPLSAIAAAVITAIVFAAGVWRQGGLAPLTAALLLLLYFSNYVYLVTAGMFYRSTKPLLAPVLMGTVFYLLMMRRPPRDARPQREHVGPPAVVFLLFCVMALLDRQGFFYATIGLLVLAADALLAQGRRDAALAAAAAVAGVVLYNIALAPLIVRWVNGYVPSFQYQQLPLSDLIDRPVRWSQAGEMLLQTNAVLFGSVPYWLAAVLLALLLVGAIRRGARKAAIVCAVVLAAQVGMFAAMIVRHPPVYEFPDHRLWYYPLPFQALVVCGLAVLLERLTAGWSGWRLAALNAVLTVLVISNLTHWEGYRQQMRQAPWFPTVDFQTFALKASFRDGRPYGTLTPEYLGFYRYCLTLSPALKARDTASRE